MIRQIVGARVIPRVVQHSHNALRRQALRSIVSKPPGSDPLNLLQKECMGRNLCDEQGNRLPGVHWVFAFAISDEFIDNVRMAVVGLSVLFQSTFLASWFCFSYCANSHLLLACRTHFRRSLSATKPSHGGSRAHVLSRH
jgi:hypothetical protein